MDRGRKMLRKRLFPHPALVFLIAAAAAIALIWAFSDGAEGNPGVYAAYTLSAYGLVLVCVRVPALVRGVRRLVREEPHIRRCMDDAGLRTRLTLIPSVAANGGYALLQLGLGILNRSVWYYALSAYYGLLLLMPLHPAAGGWAAAAWGRTCGANTGSFSAAAGCWRR